MFNSSKKCLKHKEKNNFLRQILFKGQGWREAVQETNEWSGGLPQGQVVEKTDLVQIQIYIFKPNSISNQILILKVRVR